MTREILLSYSILLKYFANSNLIPRNSKIFKEIEELVLNPISHIANIANKSKIAHNDIENICTFANSIWYAYNQRCDIRDAIPDKEIIISEDTKNEVFKYYNIPLNSPITFSLIADISGKIERDLNANKQPMNTKKQIFIVHGHDEALKQQVARFVEKLGFNAIILHEQANKGNTIIEKIEECADTTSFAIILYTGCDKGTTKNSDEFKPRARQNVIFEHGFFVGKLGRDHVCCLHEEGVELPGDLSGIVYIPADRNAAWQTTIAKEMKVVGLTVDMNKLIK